MILKYVVIGLLCVSSLFADAVTVAVGPWPPYHAANDVEADMMTQKVGKILQKSDLDLAVQFMPWARAKTLVASKEKDISISWIKTDQREQEFLFSKAIGTTKTVLYSANNYQFDIKTINDLNGLRVGHVRGYMLPKEVELAAKQGLCVIDYAKDDKQNMLKLIKGRVDLIVIDTMVAQHHAQVDFAGYKPQLQAIDSFAWEQDLHIILSKTHLQADQLLSKINQAILKS